MRNRKGNAVSGAVVLRRAHRDQGKMKIRVYLIRHGKTAGNLKQAYIGSTDQPLCPQGRAELEALAGRLPIPDEWGIRLCRCGQTAGILYGAFRQGFVPICGSATGPLAKGKIMTS